MSNSSININDKCEIIWEKDVYKSNVQDITDKYIAISLPVASGSYASLVRGDNIEVIYSDDKNVYSFYSTVIGRKKDKIPMILISIPDEDKIRRIQRRKNFRVELIEEIKYKVIGKEKITKALLNAELKRIEEFSNGTILDLSGGGTRITINEKLQRNDIIIIYLPIHDRNVLVPCSCIRCVKNQSGTYVCGFKFHEIDGNQRENIILYTFDIMRERMKKR
jgi:c-di-GMP-binding flagellar brake protein YcgR